MSPEQSMVPRPTLLLADDQTLILHALRKLLEAQFEIVALVEDGNELLQQTLRLKPQVVLTELVLHGSNALDVIGELRQRELQIKVVCVTERSEAAFVHRALYLGASGYVLKSCTSGELHRAIREVLAGRTYVTGQLNRSPECMDRSLLPASGPEVLTLREKDVLRLVAGGHSARTISEVLHISQKTVAFHKSNLRQKLAVRSGAEMATFAYRHGLLSSKPEIVLPQLGLGPHPQFPAETKDGVHSTLGLKGLLCEQP